MKLIDNKSILLGDDLKEEIKEGTKLKMVASYLNAKLIENDNQKGVLS